MTKQEFENLTRERAIEEHRKMWNWIADETEKRKYKVDKVIYFIEHKDEYPIIPHIRCWCCEYDGCHACKKCPINWKNEDNYCGNKSIYVSWDLADDFSYELCASLARQIANLPEREEVVNG